MPTIYLARHATPDWTRKDIVYHLPPGPPLTEIGQAEARALGEFFREAGVTRLFNSPLERCIRTAALAAEVSGLSTETLPSLNEWQPGETYTSVISRVMPTINRLLIDSEKHGPAGVVTHGGPVGAILKYFGMDPEAYSNLLMYDRSNPLPPAGAWKVTQPFGKDAWELELAFVPSSVPPSPSPSTG